MKFLWFKFLRRKPMPVPAPHLTGRVCIGCDKPIGKHDRWHIVAARHNDCNAPQGAPLPESLGRLIEGEKQIV